jgi:hypothetical protein
MSQDPASRQPSPVDDPPPIMGSWRNLYALVIAALAFDMFLLWLFTRAFA